MTTTDVKPPKQRSSLTVASGLLGLSAVATRLTTLVVMALLAAGAGTEAVGYYGLATLGASFTAAALSLGLPTYLTRDVSAGLVSPGEVARIHLVRFGLLLLAAGLAYLLADNVLAREIRFGMFLFFVASLLEQWNETAWVLIRGTRSAPAEPVTNTVTGLILVGACSVDAWLFSGLSFNHAAVYVAIAAVARSSAACVTVGIWRSLRSSSGPVNFAAHIKRSLPYFASDLLGLLYFRGDLFILAMFASASEVGEYVSAAAIIGPAVQMAASMGTGALAYAASRLLAGRPSTEDPLTIFQFFRLSGQAAAGLMCIGLPIAVWILFGDQAHDIFTLAMILTMFLALRFANYGLSTILLAHGRASSRLLVLVLSIFGNAALNLGLDGKFGAYGAAWATVLTELVVASSLLYFLRIRALVRPAVVAVGYVAVTATVMIGLLEAWRPTAAALLTGGLFLAVAALTSLIQRRASRRSSITEAEGA